MKNVRSEFAHDFAPRQAESSRVIDAVSSDRVSEPQILAALGFITALLLVGGIQLFRCVNAGTTSSKAIAPQSTLPFDPNGDPSISSSVKLNSFVDSQKTEILTIQNAISNGKF